MSLALGEAGRGVTFIKNDLLQILDARSRFGDLQLLVPPLGERVALLPIKLSLVRALTN